VNREAERQAPTAVGSGDLLGHWSLLNLFIELLLTLWIGTFIVCSLKSKHRLLHDVALFVSDKIAGIPAAMWTQMAGLRDWLKILKLAAKLAHLYLEGRYLRFKLRVLAREQRKLLLHQVNHVLGKTGGASNPNNLFGGVGGTHNSGGVKWPNDES
jgi:hypothetical protein